jgi:hypothetical protein
MTRGLKFLKSFVDSQIGDKNSNSVIRVIQKLSNQKTVLLGTTFREYDWSDTKPEYKGMMFPHVFQMCECSDEIFVMYGLGSDYTPKGISRFTKRPDTKVVTHVEIKSEHVAHFIKYKGKTCDDKVYTYQVYPDECISQSYAEINVTETSRKRELPNNVEHVVSKRIQNENPD